MALKTVEVRVRHLTPLAILDLSGDITNQADADLRDAYAQASGMDPAAIVLNFTKVEYINSTGIALLVGILARARAEGRRVVVYGLTDHYTEIFQITRLADFMTLYPDEESAVSDLQASPDQEH
jgi:anti-sigma B factor antagonist